MQTKRLLFTLIAIVCLTAVLSSCAKDGEDGKDGKDGAKGEQGPPGKDGKTPTLEICEETGFWIINGVTTNVPATGQAGENGQSRTGTAESHVNCSRLRQVNL